MTGRRFIKRLLKDLFLFFQSNKFHKLENISSFKNLKIDLLRPIKISHYFALLPKFL
jgi:hypothetical protein